LGEDCERIEKSSVSGNNNEDDVIDEDELLDKI
jgi:hypothetical protein